MGANRIAARESDLKDSRLTVEHINRLYEQSYALLGQIAALEEKVKSSGAAAAAGASGAAGFTPNDRRLLDALARGSTESSVPATRAIVPIVDALPPPATSTPGQLVQLRTSGIVYTFDGANWNSISAASSPHAILSATHGDSVAAAVVRGDLIAGNATPGWSRLAIGAALKLLRVNAGGTDPEWGAVDDSMLSANVALLNAANLFTQLVSLGGKVRLSTEITSGVSPYTITGNRLIVGNAIAGAYTIKLPAAPAIGDAYIILDAVGQAAVSNLTVSGNGINIDGAATYVINTNWGSVGVVAGGTFWKTWCKF